MFKYKFTYSNNTTQEKFFDSHKDADWFAHNEGDHLLEYKWVNQEQVTPDSVSDWTKGLPERIYPQSTESKQLVVTGNGIYIVRHNGKTIIMTPSPQTASEVFNEIREK